MKTLIITTLFISAATLAVSLNKNPLIQINHNHEDSNCPHLKKNIEEKRYCDSISSVLFYLEHKSQKP